MASQVSMNGGKKKTELGKKGGAVTIRLELDLAPPTEGTTNEFSYVHLLESKNQDSSSTSAPPLGSDSSDENLAAIAKRFEEKYGPKKRKRVLHESDLIDRGLGYDQSDPFVDDSEVYENYIPHQLDTRFGGFYVNMGKLEFRAAEGSSDELDFIKDKKPKKPRVKKIGSFQNTPQAILASQKLKKAKQRVALQKNPAPKKSQGVAGAGLPGNTPIKPPPAKKRKQSDPKCINGLLDSLSGSTTQVALKTVGDAPITSDDATSSSHTIQSISLSTMLHPKASSGAKPSESESGELPSNQPPKEPPVLSDQLPPTVLARVTHLEQLILKDVDASGKLPIKTRITYDQHLVDIHFVCLELSKKARNAVFDYLAYKMGVARGTLVKRLKQELKKREDTELEKCIANLKKVIDASMPDQMEAYERDVRARAASISEAEEETKTDDVFEESTNASVVTNQPAGSQEKRKAPPRKRFRWTDEARKLLVAVVKEKITDTMNKGNKVTNWEEMIGTFLDEKIKPLWPKGWMQKSILYKSSEIAHKQFTNPMSKKAVLIKKDKASSSSMLPVSMDASTTAPPKPPPTAASPTAPSSIPTQKMAGIRKELDCVKLRGPLLAAGAKAVSGATAMVRVSTPKPSSPTPTQKFVPSTQVRTTKPGAAKVLPALSAKTVSQSTSVLTQSGSTKVLQSIPAKSTSILTQAGSAKVSQSVPAKTLSQSASILTQPGSAKVLQSVSALSQSASILTQPGGAKVLQSVPAKTLGQSIPAAPQPTTNIRTAATKSSLIGGGTLSTKSDSLSSYLLSGGSLDITELLQAHINQKGGSIKIVPRSTSRSQSSQAIHLITSGSGSVPTSTLLANVPVSQTSTLLQASKPQRGKSVSSINPGSVGSSLSVKATKPGAATLPRHKLATAATGKESVVSKIMSSFSTQSPLEAPPPTSANSVTTALPPSSMTHAGGTLSSPAAMRLKLTKKPLATPQIIVPELTKMHDVVPVRDVPMSLPHTPSSPSLGSVGCRQSNALPHSTFTAPLCTAASSIEGRTGTTPTFAGGDATVHRSSGVRVVPDTPPQTLSIAIPSTSSQNQADTPSPIKSPVEQIIEEHSYPIITEPDSSQERYSQFPS